MNIRNLMLGSLALMGSFEAYAGDKNITVSTQASYYDEKIIPSNIKSECSGLGSQFSEATKNNLESDGWNVSLGNEVGASATGTTIKLQIANALSAGNAFIGHKKSVSVIAELYKDGKLVVDKPWEEGAIKLIKKAKVPVVPIYFHDKNSRLF